MNISTSDWKKWLKSKGLEFIRKKGSHEMWNYPDNKLLRPVVFRGNEKEIPLDHLMTNLRTIGVTKKEFLNEL